jgi:hypothetical protein
MARHRAGRVVYAPTKAPLGDLVTRLALLSLSLALFASPAFAAPKHKGEATYSCSYCNGLKDPVSCCHKVANCETFESAGERFCREKHGSADAESSAQSGSHAHAPAAKAKKPLEPYKPLGKKTAKRVPTFTCEHCNSVVDTASCCHKIAGCNVVDRAGGRVCKKAE